MQSRGTINGKALDADIATQVMEAIRSIRYGAVEIVIHDGRVVAIERKEKIRF